MRNHRLAALAAATTLALLSGTAAAAGRTDLHGLDVAKLNQQYKAAAAKLGVAANARDRHAELLGLDADSDLQQTALLTDADGTKHYRYTQLYRGIPVFGEGIAVTEGKDGNVRTLFGRKVEGLNAEVPAIAAKIPSKSSRCLGSSLASARRRPPSSRATIISRMAVMRSPSATRWRWARARASATASASCAPRTRSRSS